MGVSTPFFRTLDNAWSNQGEIAIPEDSVCHVEAFALASNHDGGAARWQLEVTAYRVGSGPVELACSLPQATTSEHKTQQANLWDVRLVTSATGLALEVRGGDEVVDWLLNYGEFECMEGVR